MSSHTSKDEIPATPAPARALPRYELLTLGDELLLGLTINSHVAFVGSQLARRGVVLQRNIIVTDDAVVIARQVSESWAAADVVITTGGLGPTCDDRTRESVAEVLGQKLILDTTVEHAIRERFARLGREMTPNNLKQALRPERAEVLPNPNGTAPGLWIEKDGKILCMLPGPPNELHPMFIDQVIPRLTRMGLLSSVEAYVQMRTIGIGESMLETRLQPIFDKYGEALSIAYCAHLGAVDCRVSSPSGGLSFAELQGIARECAALLGEDFLCFGHDSLAKIVADLLRDSGKMLAVAETATGGLLSNCFTDLPGVPKFFAGGAVCHSNESKMQLLDVPEEILLQHSAVSDENAVAMATGAAERMGADYALAVTGFQGTANSGDSAGPIHLALYSPRGTWSKTANWPGSRATARERAVTIALDWLRRELLATRRDAGAKARLAPAS